MNDFFLSGLYGHQVFYAPEKKCTHPKGCWWRGGLICPIYDSWSAVRHGRNLHVYQNYLCKGCGRHFNVRGMIKRVGAVKLMPSANMTERTVFRRLHDNIHEDVEAIHTDEHPVYNILDGSVTTDGEPQPRRIR